MQVLGHRVPCFHCGEAIATDAAACSHCGESALVDVRVTRALNNPRQRYELARKLADLHKEEVGSFGHASKCLDGSRAVLASHISRRQAVALERTLVGQLVPCRITPCSRPKARGGSRLPRYVWIAAAVAGLLAAAVGLVAVGARLLVGGSWGPSAGSPPVAQTDAQAPPDAASTPPDAATAPAPPARPTVAAESTPLRRLSSREVARRSMPSVVVMRCPRSIGSGFFVAAHTILTNAHAICPGVVAITPGGERLATRLTYQDTQTDVAVLSVNDLAVRPLPLATAASVHPGDTVYFLGTPRGLDFTIGRGMVSQVGVPAAKYRRFIQIDGNVNPGNSGGPVVNEYGQVVGIVTLGDDSVHGVGYALPTDVIDFRTAGLGDPLTAPPEDTPTARDGHGEVAQGGPPLNEGAHLIGVSSSHHRAVVTLAFAKRRPPPPPIIDFELKYEHRIPCIRSARVTRWAPAGAGGSLPSEARTALSRELAAEIVYVGEFRVDASACLRETIEGEGEPRLERVRVVGEYSPGGRIVL